MNNWTSDEERNDTLSFSKQRNEWPATFLLLNNRLHFFSLHFFKWIERSHLRKQNIWPAEDAHEQSKTKIMFAHVEQTICWLNTSCIVRLGLGRVQCMWLAVHDDALVGLPIYAPIFLWLQSNFDWRAHIETEWGLIMSIGPSKISIIRDEAFNMNRS